MADRQAADLCQLVDEQCDAFEQAWRDGNRPLIADFLAAVPAETRADLFGHLLAVETELIARAGTWPDAAAYRDRYPMYAEVIERVFDGLRSWAQATDALEHGPEASRAQPNNETTQAVGTDETEPSSLLSDPEYRRRSALRTYDESTDTPREFGRYALLKVLGRGGMGVVYQARDPILKRLVAIKVHRGAEHVRREEKERFRVEAEAAAGLHHPNIVQVFEVGERRGQPFIVLEYVDGPNLAELVGGQPQPPRAVAKLVRDLCLAISYAHHNRVIHRDLKPSNILIAGGASKDAVQPSKGDPPDGGGEEASLDGAGSDLENGALAGEIGDGAQATPDQVGTSDEQAPAKSGWFSSRLKRDWKNEGPGLQESPNILAGREPKLTDFGLAKQLDSDRELTMTGDVFGTPQYMAPEQAAGATGDAGPATDVYSLGAILYYLLTGRAPFHAPSLAETMRMVLEQPPPSPHVLEPHLPTDIVTICLHCLEKDPGRRYQSAEDLAEELARFRRGDPIVARPVGRTERAIRWCRRNRVIAALLTTCLTLFVAGFAGVTWKWRDAATNAIAAHSATELAVASAGEARKARVAMQRQMSRVLFRQGIDKCEQGNSSEGLHWLVDSLRAAPDDPADRRWREIVRTNLSGWRARTPAYQWRRELPGRADALAWSPQAEMVVLGGIEGKILRFDTLSGDLIGDTIRLGISQEGWSGIWGLAFHPSRKWFMAAAGSEQRAIGQEGLLQRVDAESGELLGARVRFAMPVRHVAISPDGQLYVAAYFEPDQDKPLAHYTSIRRCADDQPVGPDQQHGIELTRLSFSEGGDLLLCEGRSAAGEERFCVLDARRNAAVVEWRAVEQMKAIGAGPDGITIAPDGMSAPVRFVRPQGGSRQQALPLAWRNSLNDPTHRFTAVRTAYSTALLKLPRGLSRGERAPRADRTFNWYQRVHVAGNRQRIAAADSAGAATIVDLRSRLPKMIVRHPGDILSVALSHDGLWCATGVTDVRVWNVESGELRFPPRPHTNTISSLAFSPDGRTLAAGDYSGSVLLWNVQSGALVGEALKQRDIVTCMSFSPDGSRLAVGTASDWNHDPQGRLWDVKSQEPIGEPMRHANYVRRIQFCPHGDKLLTASSDATVRIWDAHTAKPIGESIPFTQDLCPAVFSPDGRMILTGYQDGRVRGWNAATGQPISSALARGHDQVTALEFSGDGDRFAVGYRNGASQLFDAVEFEPVGPAAFQSRAIKQIVVNQHGSVWTTILNDGTIRSWDAPAPQPGTSDEISLELKVDTGLDLDSHQMRVELTLSQWSALREQEQRESGRARSAVALGQSRLSEGAWNDARALDAEEIGDWHTARWHLRHLMSATPDDWRLVVRLARTYSAQHQFEKAATSYAEAARALGEHGASRLQAWQRFRVAEARRRENWESAKWYLERLMQSGSDPDAAQQLREIQDKFADG